MEQAQKQIIKLGQDELPQRRMYSSIPLERTTFVNYNFKKRALERELGKKISNDDFVQILLFDRKIIMTMRKKSAKVDVTNGTMFSL